MKYLYKQLKQDWLITIPNNQITIQFLHHIHIFCIYINKNQYQIIMRKTFLHHNSKAKSTQQKPNPISFMQRNLDSMKKAAKNLVKGNQQSDLPPLLKAHQYRIHNSIKEYSLSDFFKQTQEPRQVAFIDKSLYNSLQLKKDLLANKNIQEFSTSYSKGKKKQGIKVRQLRYGIPTVCQVNFDTSNNSQKNMYEEFYQSKSISLQKKVNQQGIEKELEIIKKISKRSVQKKEEKEELPNKTLRKVSLNLSVNGLISNKQQNQMGVIPNKANIRLYKSFQYKTLENMNSRSKQKLKYQKKNIIKPIASTQQYKAKSFNFDPTDTIDQILKRTKKDKYSQIQQAKIKSQLFNPLQAELNTNTIKTMKNAQVDLKQYFTALKQSLSQNTSKISQIRMMKSDILEEKIYDSNTELFQKQKLSKFLTIKKQKSYPIDINKKQRSLTLGKKEGKSELQQNNKLQYSPWQNHYNPEHNGNEDFDIKFMNYINREMKK